MRTRLFFIIVSIGIAFFVIAVLTTSHSWYIARTKDLEEVKAILDIHSEPHISVERGENTSVVYEVSRTQLEGKPYDPNKNCLYLKVRTGYFGYPEDLWTESSRYELGDEGIVEFLERGGGCVFTLINAIPEGAVMNKTKEFEEVIVFLERYPLATSWISKLINFEVAYRMTKSEVTGESWDKPGVPESAVFLYMQLDRHLELESMWISCHVNTGETADVYDIYEDLVNYLKQDGHCWDDDSLTVQNPPPGWQD